MAEYIDRDLIEWCECSYKNAGCENRDCSGCSHARCFHSQVMQIPPVDVVQRSEYIELLKENERLREDLKAKSEALNSICQIHQEYKSKVDNAIKEIEILKGYEMRRFSEDVMYHKALKKCLDIFKENLDILEKNI